jgi:putative methyltransferase (TIGR04325 family)
MLNYKNKIKKFIPPILTELFFSFYFRNSSLRWVGKFDSWKTALLNSTSYNSLEILEKCKSSLLKVKNGEAVFERDSVIFNEIHYSWPVLAILQKAAMEYDNKLCVLDFGGSLGTSYFQNKDFLSPNIDIRWCIVEQQNFVECGKSYFQTENLLFFDTIEDCLKENKPNVILLSSVLQYIENPKQLIKKLINYNINYIIIDRTPVSINNDDMITVQQVPKEIYNASYPCRIFSKNKLLNEFRKYKIITEFNNGITADTIINNTNVSWNGYLLQISE